MNIQALFTPSNKTTGNQTTITNNISSASSDITQKNNLNISDLSDPARQAVELAVKQGVQLTDENIAVIATFMDEAPGTTVEKLMALSVALEKQLPLTATILSDIQTARAISLVDCIDTLAPKQLGHTQNTTSDSHTTMRNQVVEELDGLLCEFLEALDDSAKLSAEDTTEVFKDKQTIHASDKLNGESKLDQTKSAVEQQISSLLAELPTDIAFEALFNTLHHAQLDANEQLSNTSKLVLEETITQKLAEVKNSFEVFKRETISQLEQIVDADNKLTKEQRIHYTAKLIDKLDNAIMKSEIGLYISMKSERDLMKQSATLDEARQLLLNGKLEKAESIVRTVVENFQKMPFKPTLKRVIALGNPLNLSADELKYDAIAKWSKDSIANFTNSDKSVAGLVHYLRRMGINHEVEAFQSTFSNSSKNEESAAKNIRNLKEMLLTMAQKNDNQEQPKSAEKILSHINGQQMQLKITDKAATQQLMLSVPLNINDRLTEVKVFIKAQENNLKVDWQNFNMFFVLNTARFDDIGIKVSAVEKKMRIDILNDNIESRAIVMPLANQLSNYVESIGYTVTGLNFSTLLDEAHPNQVVAPKKSEQTTSNNLNTTYRSFDFSV